MWCCADKGAKEAGAGDADAGTGSFVSGEEGKVVAPVEVAAYTGEGPAQGASAPETPEVVEPAAAPAPAPEPVVEAPKQEPAETEPAKPAETPQPAEAPKPAPAAAPAPAVEYTITVTKTAGETLGLSFDGMDDMAVVTDVKDVGVIAKHNKTASPGEQVASGDRLLEVNGKGGNLKELAAEMGKIDKLSIKFKRAQNWEIQVDKAKGLGLSLAHKEASSALFVGELNAGAIKTWNEANPQAAVMKGDRILSVNGQSGPATQVIEAIKNANGILTIKFAR